VARLAGTHRSTIYELRGKHLDAFRKAEAMGQESAVDRAMGTVLGIMDDPTVSPRVRLRAVEIIYRRYEVGGFARHAKREEAAIYRPLPGDSYKPSLMAMGGDPLDMVDPLEKSP
jgi:hypothetical protein